MPNNVFDKPSEAFATIPKGSMFRLKESTNGRPIDVPRPDGELDWDVATFNQALADGAIPKRKYVVRPLAGTGKQTARRISLDLSMSEESMTVEGPGGTNEALATQPSAQGYFVQEVVVQALVTSYQEAKQDTRDLAERLDDKNEEIIALKLEVASLKHQIEHSADTDSLEGTFKKFLLNLAQGPGGAILTGKLLGHGSEMSAAVTTAMNGAAAPTVKAA